MASTPVAVSRAAIALGSNIGNSASILKDALKALDQHPQVSLVRHSSWYRTVPVGPVQDDFLNGCALLETDLTAAALLELLLSTEQDFGRIRLEHWGPRSLDLDLILYGNQVIATERLQVPHPRLAERSFVLTPLAEIAPEWIEPTSGKTISELASQLGEGGILERLA
ncbi:MAG: 2-amino-4-hydroxy-6-hydroxymethyldihydropteridine diphosphokinase [Cyanobacteria bacterium]|nr:2-amino-4-hydroxy-6-hydroxymethyldihydropteridine diphosphokinase [Cyanobacteriota bacterium]